MDTTTLHITGTHALMLHRAARAGKIVRAVPTDVRTVAPPPLRKQSIDKLGLTSLVEWLRVTRESPLEVLSPNANSRCRTEFIRDQVISDALPFGSFLELTEGSDTEGSLTLPSNVRVLIDAPPLILANMSQDLTEKIHEGKMDEFKARIHLIALGCELCGSYARDPIEPQVERCHFDDCGKCNRYATPDEVRTTLSDLRGVKGIARARYVAQYILDHTGSPMETYIDLALFLPPRLGGLGMSMALLNKQFSVTDETLSKLKHTSLRPDIQWPDFNTLAEYLGDEEHASKRARVEDKNRIQDYATAGYASFFLMYDDVNTPKALNRTAEMLANALEERGDVNALKRMRRTCSIEGFYVKQAKLIAALLPPVTRYDQGGY